MQTRISIHRLLGLAALVTLLPACGGPKSSSTGGKEGAPVPTSKMTIDFRVESSEPGTAVVRTNLNDGKALGLSYRLDGGDYLTACVIGVCHNLADNDSVTSPDYISRFDYQPGVDYVVSFNRRQSDDAPESRVALPPAFTIVTPADHQQVTDGETVLVSWTPSGAPATVALVYDADCKLANGTHAFGGGSLSAGDGSASVAIDPIVTFSNLPSAVTRCSIAVTVRHELQGQIDPAFHGGTARGIVLRVVNLDYVPR
jgi:hypothetical protein